MQGLLLKNFGYRFQVFRKCKKVVQLSIWSSLISDNEAKNVMENLKNIFCRIQPSLSFDACRWCLKIRPRVRQRPLISWGTCSCCKCLCSYFLPLVLVLFPSLDQLMIMFFFFNSPCNYSGLFHDPWIASCLSVCQSWAKLFQFGP